MNILATALLAFATFGTAAVAAECTDLAGQGTLCQEATADPNSGVDVDVVLTLDPQVPPLPPPPALSVAGVAPTCEDLAGQGTACHEIDPTNGVLTVVVSLDPQPPVA